MKYCCHYICSSAQRADVKKGAFPCRVNKALTNTNRTKTIGRRQELKRETSRLEWLRQRQTEENRRGGNKGKQQRADVDEIAVMYQ